MSTFLTSHLVFLLGTQFLTSHLTFHISVLGRRVLISHLSFWAGAGSHLTSRCWAQKSPLAFARGAGWLIKPILLLWLLRYNAVIRLCLLYAVSGCLWLRLPFPYF